MVRMVATKLGDKEYSALVEFCSDSGYDSIYECVKSIILKTIGIDSSPDTLSRIDELDKRLRKLEKTVAAIAKHLEIVEKRLGIY